MNKEKGKPENIDEYITGFSKDVQEILAVLRTAIRKAAPAAEEGISYQMPVFKLEGNLVYFAAFKNHIGFYPTSSGIKAFEKDLSRYKWARGSVQFPIDKPLPLGLVVRIVKYRVKENLMKAASKTKKEGTFKG
jgi:uncharacterized protein YdhG (YjbR/CyaY superfamily)